MANEHHNWNWRRKKREVRKRVEALNSAGFFIDCRGHPCRITRLVWYRTDGDCDGISLIDGTGGGCSIFHCAPDPISEAEAKKMAEAA